MKLIKLFLVLAVITVMVSCNNNGITKKELKTELDTVSYVLGLDLASKVGGNFPEIDKDLLQQGLRDGIDSTGMVIDQKDVDGILRAYFQKKQETQRAEQQAEALKKAESDFADIKLEGEKFLELNKDEKGVITTDSGLQYSVIKKANGDKPVATSKVKVHYHGTLLDGTVFDSSVDRGTPAEFLANRVIKGWTEGLQLMSVGSKYKFFIPQELGYGATPRQGGKIRPYEVIVFEVELIDIVE